MNALLETVAQHLSRVRAEEGIDLEDAAYEAKVAPERLAAAEAAELALTEDELSALADVYGVDVTAFFGGRTTPVEYLLGF